jgi:hypothetical protein
MRKNNDGKHKMLESKTKNGQQAQFRNYSTTWKNDKASSRVALNDSRTSSVTNCCKLATFIQNCWMYLGLTAILSYRQKLKKFILFSAFNKLD